MERMCALAGVSRAAYYRAWGCSDPLREETALRDVIQRLALANRHYGYRRIGALLRREVRVEQPHGSVEVHETGTVLDDLLLQMAHDPAQLGSLRAQSVHDVRLGHCSSPSQNIKVQDGSRPAPPVRTRAWWQLLHDAGIAAAPTRRSQVVLDGPTASSNGTDSAVPTWNDTMALIAKAGPLAAARALGGSASK